MTRSAFDAAVEAAVQRDMGKRPMAECSRGNPREEVLDNMGENRGDLLEEAGDRQDDRSEVSTSTRSK